MPKPTPAQKAALYNRLKRRFGLTEIGLAAAYLALLLVSGWTFDLRDLAMGFGGGPAVWVLVYFMAAAGLFELLSLPTNVLSGYFLEKRFGLLNQTFRAWAADWAKSQLVGFVLGLVALETLYLLFRLAGTWWWLPASLVFALFFVLLAQLAPVLILPLFFRFRKLPEGDLTRRLTDLCRRAGVEVIGVYEWGLTARTNRANAALLGWGSTRRVVLSDSLLVRFPPSEIEVVLAHELGHHHLGHMPKLIGLQIGLTVLAFVTADLIYRGLGQTLGLTGLNDLAGMPLLALGFMAVSLAAWPLVNAISRYMERQADYFALDLTGLSGSFIALMERLAVLNLAEFEPHPAVEALFHSHPAPAKRVRAAKDFLKSRGGQDHALR
ncbi:MAG: M48 family metalloprotease [Proteobacteria bacterium]|nr:M48 family metalloprotease [Pseudomonadota bacterium]